MINFFKIIFRYLFNKKDKNYYAPLQYEIEYEKNPLPPWEEIIEMCYDKQLGGYEDYMEKVIYSESKNFRAIIFKTSTDVYTVSYEKLYPWDEDSEWEMSEYWSGGLPGYWGGFSTSAVSTNSFYDSLKTAEREIFSMPEFNKPKYKIYHRSYADMEEMYDDFKDYISNIRLENNKIHIEHNKDVLVIEKGVNGSFYTYRNGEKEKGEWDDQDLFDYALEFVK